MHHFHYVQGQLCCERVALAELAERCGTPCFVYSDATLTRHFRVFDEALASVPHLICFSAKANSNIAVLGTLARLGSGLDIVSRGELYRAIRAGVPAERIVFSGVGKQRDEIEQALKVGILLFNVESADELALIHEVAASLGRRAPIALRVNPDVDPQTHPYVATGLRKSKFGVPLAQARELYLAAKQMPQLDVCGIDCHIGSQLTSVEPFVESVNAMAALAHELSALGIELRYIDVGGGLGIRYGEEVPPSPAEYGKALSTLLDQMPGKPTVICEPGRAIAGNAGVLLTRVLYVKDTGHKRFIVVDAAMTDLLRPSLYSAFHDIWPVAEPREGASKVQVDVVGPVCESADFLARDRPLSPVRQGDLLAVMSAGAYGFSMGSNYNSRPRPAELMVRDESWCVIREREQEADLIRGEKLPAWL